MSRSAWVSVRAARKTEYPAVAPRSQAVDQRVECPVLSARGARRSDRALEVGLVARGEREGLFRGHLELGHVAKLGGADDQRAMQREHPACCDFLGDRVIVDVQLFEGEMRLGELLDSSTLARAISSATARATDGGSSSKTSASFGR